MKSILSIGIMICWAVQGGAQVLICEQALRPDGSQTSLPAPFVLTGDALFADLSEHAREHAGWGVRFPAGRDVDKDGSFAGSIQANIPGITPDGGRWYRLEVTGLAQEDFHVEKEDLYLKVAFFKNQGETALDQIKQHLYAQVERDRADLKDPGTNPKLGSSTWRQFALEFRTPFPDIDSFIISAGFDHGAAKGPRHEFWINRIELKKIPDPATCQVRQVPAAVVKHAEELVALGGRWYFDPRGGSTSPPVFDHTNADQLLYRSDRFTAPFAGNMTAWLRKGFLDLNGNMVEADRHVQDNVRISVSDTHLVIRSKNLPNHPVAKFPDRWRALDGNPNYVAEQDKTWHLPLEPRPAENRVAMKNKNNNDHALPMGAIGVAINGVVFFNPFDHLLDEDAVWRLDRCCGHPAPNSMYHYHKYPVCVKSPWTDDGEGHSPVIGFAFDGFPVYGPYEAKGELAKESKSNPLNAFNVHQDQQRGWHYHVTPGQFPHIIGGYWGELEMKNRSGRREGRPIRRGPGRFRRPVR